LEENDPARKWLRENVEFFIVPFIDKDGVEDGDQGKNRRPWDHVLDYSDNNIYNSTASLKKELQKWGKGQLKVALDFHCPWLFGEWNEHIYFVGAKDERIAREQRAFVDAIKKNRKGELRLDPDPKRSIRQRYGNGIGSVPSNTKQIIYLVLWLHDPVTKRLIFILFHTPIMPISLNN
jgi:hypothetical protein